MLLKKKLPVEKTALQKTLDSILSQMEGYDADSAEYAKMVEQYVKLTGTHPPVKEARFKLDTLITAGAGLAGIVIIIIFEKAGNVMSSKSFSLAKFK